MNGAIAEVSLNLSGLPLKNKFKDLAFKIKRQTMQRSVIASAAFSIFWKNGWFASLLLFLSRRLLHLRATDYKVSLLSSRQIGLCVWRIRGSSCMQQVQIMADFIIRAQKNSNLNSWNVNLLFYESKLYSSHTHNRLDTWTLWQLVECCFVQLIKHYTRLHLPAPLATLQIRHRVPFFNVLWHLKNLFFFQRRAKKYTKNNYLQLSRRCFA